METDYARKLNEEINRYKDVLNIHELPGIFHYWSNKYLAPVIRSYGFQSINDIYVHYMREACQKDPGKTMRFISIGAGNCELEVDLALKLHTEGIRSFVFECLDINPDMLERGRQLAIGKNVGDLMAFKATDLNYWDVEHTYEIIIAAQCLHHFVELELIFEKIYEYLSPRGFFITHDMIGRNGHQRWPETLGLVHEFWGTLPDRYKFNHQLQRLELEFMDWDCSVEGFEGIRAQDILPLLNQKFHFEFFVYWGGVIDIFIDRGFGHNYDPKSDWDRRFIDQVQQVNFEKILEGAVKPTQMIAAMSKVNFSRKLYWYGLAPEFCTRYTDDFKPVKLTR
jgi:SAM-dependent methyltransferase